MIPLTNPDPSRPLVTVILRTYEGDYKYLNRSLPSVFAQDLDLKQVQLILACDGKPSDEMDAEIERLLRDRGKEFWSASVAATDEPTGYYCVPSNHGTN